MGIPGATWRRASAVAAAGVAVLAIANAGAQSGSCPSVEVRQGPSGKWTLYAPPQFPDGEPNITAHAVDPQQPERWYVTNGTAVVASQDGGCSWKPAYVLPAQPSPDQPLDRNLGRITGLSAGGGNVFATVTGPVDGADVPGVQVSGVPDALTLVVASADGGGTWTTAGTFTNEGGRTGAIVQARSEPKVVYVATGGRIRRSTDGGANWQTSALPQIGGGSVKVETIAVDPTNPAALMVRAQGYVARSDNGGDSFQTVTLESPPSGQPLFGPVWGKDGKDPRPGRVVLSAGGDPGNPAPNEWWVSQNDGGKFARVTIDDFGRLSGVVTSMAAGVKRDDLVVTTRTDNRRGGYGIYRWHPPSERLVDYDDQQVGAVQGALSDAGNDPTYYFFQERRLVRWEIDAAGLSSYKPPGGGPKRPPDATGPRREDGEPEPPPDDFKGPQGNLTPPAGEVEVPAGATTSVDYRFQLPSRPGRLDTFFLLDTSGSTDPYIEALSAGLEGLAQDLTTGGIDARFGLGEYQDVYGVRYRRRADIRPVDSFLKMKLDSVRTNGGAEPGYTAIHQAVTGTGIEDPPDGDEVPPGRNAHWRKATARLIFHVADEAFSEDPYGADRDATVAALKKENVKFVGVVVPPNPLPSQANSTCEQIKDITDQTNVQASPVNQNTSALALKCQLVDLAKETGTFAPPGGVDCNGDRIPDLAEGEPMVCVVQKGELGGLPDAVHRLLLAIPLVQPMGLRASEGSEIKVNVVPGGDYSARSLYENQDLAFRAEFSCEADQHGKEFEITLQAVVGELPVAEAKPTVLCGSKKKAAIVPPPPVKPAKPSPPAPKPAPAAVPQLQPAPAVAPQQPPPPARVPAQAPSVVQAQAPAPSTGQAANPQVTQAQVSVAQQQKQVQVAVEYVGTDDGTDALENFEFASAPQDAPGEWPWIIRTVGALGVFAAAGAAMSRRRRYAHRTRKVYETR